jgi:regulator of sigma E protease
MAFGSVLLAFLGIGLLIFLHEMGHFLAARLAGVRVEVFSLGFGPRLLGIELGGTDFRISLVPFGGYVMVAGQDPADTRYPRRESLHSKSVAQRTLFWSGGVLMNLLFALVVFPFVFHAGVPMTAPVAGLVEPGSAAWEAGIEPGERIVTLQGRPVVSMEALSTGIALHGPRPATLEVAGADGSRRTITATPKFHPKDRLSVLGLQFPVRRVLLEPHPAGPAARAGIEAGDELLAWNDLPARGSDLRRLELALAEPGQQPITVRVRRDGSERQFTMTAEPAPTSAPRLGVKRLPRRVDGIRAGAALPAALGLRTGDVVLALDGFVFAEPPTAIEPDRIQLRLRVRRDGQELELSAPAGPADAPALFAAIHLGFDDTLLLQPTPGSPAAAGGLQTGDRLVAIDGKPVADFDALRAAVQAAGEQPLRLQLQRLPLVWPAAGEAAATTLELELRPRLEAALDLRLDLLYERQEEEIRADSLAGAVQLGVTNSLELVKQFLVTLKRLATGDVGAKNLSGIVGISRFSYQAAQRGTSWFWYFLALLSVNLAFVNLLPIPVLDGGHLLFLLIERIKGSPVSTRVLGYSQVTGLVFVLMLVLFVTYNDILRLF